MIEIVPFKYWHLKKIKPRKLYQLTGDVTERIEQLTYISTAHVFTFLDNDRVVAVIGGHLLYRGVAEIWGLLSDMIVNYKIFFTRVIRKLMDYYHKKYSLWRYQLIVPVAVKNPKKYAKSFGFEYEGYMKKFDRNKGDCLLFGRTY